MTILRGARPFSPDSEAVTSGSYSSRPFSAEALDVPHHDHCRRFSDGWVVGSVSHTLTVKAKAKAEMNLLNLFQRLNPDNYPSAKTVLDGLNIKLARHQHWFIFCRLFFVLFVCVFSYGSFCESCWPSSTWALGVDRVISETLVDQMQPFPSLKITATLYCNILS